MVGKSASVSMLGLTLLLAGALMHSGAASAEATQQMTSQRMAVKLPSTLRDHFLENMRDHLLAVSQIQAALAEGKFDEAAGIAQMRLGINAPSAIACKPGMKHMSQLALFMPEGMRKAGSKMHNAADRFATDMKTSDYRSAFSSLAKVTQACVACHAAYRIER